MAGCWYLPQKMSTREARGNNLLKAGIFSLAAGFGAKQRDSLGQELPSFDTFEETLWDELPQGGDFLIEMRAKRRRLGRLSGVIESGGGFSSKPPQRTAPIRGSRSAATYALPGARCWDPAQHHGQYLPRPPRKFTNSSCSTASRVCAQVAAQLGGEQHGWF